MLKVFAQGGQQGGGQGGQQGGGSGGRLDNPIAANSFQELATQILGVVSTIGGILAVFFIIYSGFLFVTAGGNEEKRKQAKWALLYAVIGTAILVGAQGISLIIQNTVASLK